MPDSDLLVSIVSLTHNRREKVGRLLDAVQRQSYTPLETILVDNGSSDGTGSLVRQQFPAVRLLSIPENQGMVAYNAGLQAARGEFVLVMDDDGLPVGEDWVEQVVARFRANPRLGVVCCRIQMRDTGRTAEDNPLFVPAGGADTGYPAAAYNGTGAGIRSAALHQAGYYPTYFYRSWLEAHLCTRILDAGWEVRYFPRIPVWHDRPSGSVDRLVTYYGIRNFFWYLWSLCPGPGQATLDTFHYLSILGKRTLAGRVGAPLVLRATRDAFLGGRQVRRARRPVSAETWRYLMGIRGRRNRYGTAHEAAEAGLCA